jgi:hypothetical protein
MKLSEHVACVGERKRAEKIWVGKPEGRRTLEKHNHNLEDNIKLHLKGTE